MQGYWQRDDATAAVMGGGWFHTGDIATMDDDGYFFIVDRKKDVIIRGGYNVYPREIEEILYAHPAVREAAVVAVPDESLGEEVGAAVVLETGAPDDRGRAARLREVEGGCLQVPARDLVHRRAPEGTHREDPQTTDRSPDDERCRLMAEFDITQLDITEQNVAVEKVLATTENPRHRYLLQAYLRHRYLESAGRWPEILEPELTVEHPHYRFSLIHQGRFALDGRDQVAALYGHWTATDQCVFYVEDESVAVGDHLIVGRGISYQQTLGAELVVPGVDADPERDVPDEIADLHGLALRRSLPSPRRGRLGVRRRRTRRLRARPRRRADRRSRPASSSTRSSSRSRRSTTASCPHEGGRLRARRPRGRRHPRTPTGEAAARRRRHRLRDLRVGPARPPSRRRAGRRARRSRATTASCDRRNGS